MEKLIGLFFVYGDKGIKPTELTLMLGLFLISIGLLKLFFWAFKEDLKKVKYF